MALPERGTELRTILVWLMPESFYSSALPKVPLTWNPAETSFKLLISLSSNLHIQKEKPVICPALIIPNPREIKKYDSCPKWSTVLLKNMCAHLKTMSVCKKLKGIHTERLGKVRSVQATTIRGKLREMVWPSGWPWNMKGSGYIGQCGAVGEEGTLGRIFPGLNSAWLLKGGVTSG